MKNRPQLPKAVEVEVLANCSRRCCLCFGIENDMSEKHGQIAHLDGNPQNNLISNLVFLCLEHHDRYDTRSSQSKGITTNEVRYWRDELIRLIHRDRAVLQHRSPALGHTAHAEAIKKPLDHADPELQADLGDAMFRAFSRSPLLLAQHMRVQQFRSLVFERTRHFVGRGFLLKAVDDYTANRTPGNPTSGYVVIHGEPGIGKTALLAQMVKQKGHVHHFNTASQNIRSVRDFLANVCAQLITRYQLPYTALPPNATTDSGFLAQLLLEVKNKYPAEPLVILVDALDEAERLGSNAGANVLCLPPTLPDGVWVVATTRPRVDTRLFVDYREDIYLRADDPKNLEDVRDYVKHFLRAYAKTLVHTLKLWRLNQDDFIDLLTTKSEGNFMYLFYVLRDIRDAKLPAQHLASAQSLPQGLREYYRCHWDTMRADPVSRDAKNAQSVVCLLATIREPVTMTELLSWTALDRQDIKRVIDAWREFLNLDVGETGETLYRIYHSSFQDFLKEEIGLASYHGVIGETALRKMSEFLNEDHSSAI